MAFSDSRNLKDVERWIELAKLDKSDLEVTTQSLHASSDLHTENVVLMEVNSKLLDEILHGKRLTLRGSKEDTAIVCSDSTTYELREATTSNSLLLVPGLDLPKSQPKAHNVENITSRCLVQKHICGIHHTYLEPRECQPKLQKLRKILEENPFKGPEYEPDNEKPKYSLEDLLTCIQSTESQLKNGIADIPAYLINGFYRVLDFDYHWQVLNFILDLVDSNSWALKQVQKAETIATLEELVPKELLDQCFHHFCIQVEGDIYQLREDRVCRFHADALLRNAEKFHREEFHKVWQSSVPEGMTTKMEYLKGVALEDRTAKPEVIFFFPVWRLPEDIPSRLDALFSAKEKWTYEEIEPYLQDLSSSSLNVSALLTKYARSSTKNGIRLFNAKHPLKK